MEEHFNLNNKLLHNYKYHPNKIIQLILKVNIILYNHFQYNMMDFQKTYLTFIINVLLLIYLLILIIYIY